MEPQHMKEMLAEMQEKMDADQKEGKAEMTFMQEKADANLEELK
jgi:hypothetical protein